MADEQIPQPVPFTEAFAREDEAALLSQAASLLLLGAQLDEEPVALEAAAAADERNRRGSSGPRDLAPPDDVQELGVPRVGPSAARFDAGALRDFAAETARADRGTVEEAPTEMLAILASAVEAERDPRSAAALIEAATHHPYEVVRVAAAIAALPTVADPLPEAVILAEGTRSDDPLVRDMAATGLARFDPEHPALAALREPGGPSGGGEPTYTSLLVHGTFARQSSWWQPGGDFHSYVLSDVRTDLYSASDRFEWSGGYSDAARALAASDLVAWVSQRSLQGLDVFAHSHGGNAAMLATHQGLSIGTLVLLSCPVHWHKYSPDFNRVRRVVSIRVRLDLVILADLGGQRFRDSRIEENRLPIWFRHSVSHDPDVWRDHNLPSRV